MTKVRLRAFDVGFEDMFRRNGATIASKVHSDLVMMDPGRGLYYGITGVGGRIWDLLENPTSVQCIAQIISGEFDVDEASCIEDVSAFVIRLTDLGLVERVR